MGVGSLEGKMYCGSVLPAKPNFVYLGCARVGKDQPMLSLMSMRKRLCVGGMEECVCGVTLWSRGLIALEVLAGSEMKCVHDVEFVLLLVRVCVCVHVTFACGLRVRALKTSMHM